MRMTTFLSRLLAPAVCFSCKERLPMFYEGILCPECEKDIKARSEKECDRCKNPIAFCHCSKKVLYARNCKRHVKFLNYDPKRRDLNVNRLIYSMKEKSDRELYDSLASFMEESLTCALISERVENKLKDAVVTYVPRSRYAIRKMGFDQGNRIYPKFCFPQLSIVCSLRGVQGRQIWSRVPKYDIDQDFSTKIYCRIPVS